MLFAIEQIFNRFTNYNFYRILLLCPQKQCLSGKADGLSAQTNQRLPPGGSSRRSRVRESALRYNQYKSKVARAPSVTLRVPPSSRRKAMLPPDSTSKSVTHYTLQARRVKKDREFSCSLSFSVGANCVRPRAFTERPYEDDFLSAGKPALWEAPLSGFSFFRAYFTELCA